MVDKLISLNDIFKPDIQIAFLNVSIFTNYQASIKKRVDF